MSVTQTRVEGGLRSQRLEFIREDALGLTPADPTFIEYSPTTQQFAWTPEAEPQGRRAIGSEDVISWEQGPEVHDLTIVYDLVRWINSSTDVNDAAYDAIFRGPDGLMDSHTVVAREEKGYLQATNTINGDEQRTTRIYSVARGAVPAELEIQGDPSDAFPVQIELSYRAQTSRSFQIDQPADGAELEVVSDDPADTGIDVTVESEDASASETVSLDGTTPVAVGTAGDFDAANGGVDHFELSAEAEGTVTLQESNAGDPIELAHINGKSSYGDLEGDLGVPAMGAGDRDTAPAEDPETFIGATINRGADALRHEIPSAVLRVSNELEEMELATQRAMGVYAGDRTIEMDCTMFGETTTHNLFDEYLRTVEDDIVWELATGDITVHDAVYTEPGERAVETSQAVMEVDATWSGQDVSIEEV